MSAWTVRYFFSRSSVASLRKIGRRRFAAFAKSQGNDTSMRSASSSTSMLAAAVCPSARMRKRNVSPSQVPCSIAISPRLPLVRAKPSLRRRTASTFPRRWPTMTVTVSLTESLPCYVDVHKDHPAPLLATIDGLGSYTVDRVEATIHSQKSAVGSVVSDAPGSRPTSILGQRRAVRCCGRQRMRSRELGVRTDRRADRTLWRFADVRNPRAPTFLCFPGI